MNEITNTRIMPLTGDAATKYAQSYLKSQHVQEAVVRQLTNIVGKANRTVRVAKEFEPPQNPAGEKPQTPQRLRRFVNPDLANILWPWRGRMVACPSCMSYICDSSGV